MGWLVRARACLRPLEVQLLRRGVNRKLYTMGPIGYWNGKSCFEFVLVRDVVTLDHPRGSDHGSEVLVEAPEPPAYREEAVDG